MRFNKKGTILITSLWILTILSILAIGIGFRVSIEVRLSKYNMDRLKGVHIAKSGIFKSQELLSRDNSPYDSIRQCGFVLPAECEVQDVFTEKLGDGTFIVSYDEEGRNYYGMMDEDRKININKASLAVLRNLLVNEEVALSIINWRSPGSGLDDNYYKSLTSPYECKHAEFCAIEELLLVKGVTPELFSAVKDYVTVYGEGKVNINTATRRVLLAFGLNETAVQGIIDYRNGIDNMAGTKDDLAFYSIPRQGEFQYLSNDDVARLENFTTVSNYFKVESKGMIDKSKISAKIACIIKRGDKKLVSYREY
ncbi:MAG: type II secretion system protein GspK [Candidatus Omnitrophota bacterium]|nr:type II secretion system protein GspK [Candidatus Omnitrophota bacterium]